MNTKNVLLGIFVILTLVFASLTLEEYSQVTPTQTLTSTTTATMTVTAPDAYPEGEVANAYATHLAQLSDRDITALGAGYESNATMEWTGVGPGWNGDYSGVGNIKILWASVIGKFINFSVSDEHQSIGINGDVSLVNSTFDFRGWSYYVCGPQFVPPLAGNMTGSVTAQDVYERVSTNSSSWSIARETWNFTKFQCSPVTISQSTTTQSSSIGTLTTSTLPTCYGPLDTVLNPAPKGTVYMKVVTDQGAVITNGTLFVTQSGTINGEGLEATYCIKLSDVNGTGYLQLAGNATFITSGYYSVALIAGYDQGPAYWATTPLIVVVPNSTIYVTVSVPSGVLTAVTSNEESGTITTITTSVTTIVQNGG
jgi:hypothetical protein